MRVGYLRIHHNHCNPRPTHKYNNKNNRQDNHKYKSSHSHNYSHFHSNKHSHRHHSCCSHMITCQNSHPLPSSIKSTEDIR